MRWRYLPSQRKALRAAVAARVAEIKLAAYWRALPRPPQRMGLTWGVMTYGK